MSPETLSSEQFCLYCTLYYNNVNCFIASAVNTESATDVPLVALTSTPMPSTSKAESICTDEPSMPFPSNMSVINTGTSGSNTSSPHSSPQKGMTSMCIKLKWFMSSYMYMFSLC